MTETLLDVPQELIEQIDAYSANMFFNSMLGAGSNEYDSSNYDEIAVQYNLSDSEIFNLYRNSRIAQRIVDVYPNESSIGVPVFNKTTYKTYGITSESLKTYITDKLSAIPKQQSLEKLFRTVSASARLMGVAYLVMGFDDGNSYDQPLDEENIKDLLFIKQKKKYELIPNDSLDPEFYYFFNRLGSDNQILESKIHASRVLKFTGISDLPEVFEQTRNYDSVFQATIKDLVQCAKAQAVGNQMLVKKATLWAKLRIAQAANTETKRANVQARLREINLAMGIYRMLGLNVDEEVGSNQIALDGIDKVFNSNIDWLVSSSGMNRFKIIGNNASEGLGQSSRGFENRMDHAGRCHAYSVEFWHDHFLRIFTLFCRIKTSPTKGKVPNGLSVNFPSNLVLFPQDWAELRNANSQWAKTLVELEVLSKHEVRMAFFESNDLESQVVPNLALNIEFSEALEKKVKEEMEKKEGQLIEAQKNIGVLPDPKDLKVLESKNEESIDEPADKIETKSVSLSKVKKALDLLAETDQDDLDETMESIIDE